MRISWLGHSTVLVETERARLLTDPVLRERVAHLRRHASPVAAVGPVDGVLLSHLHHDHLDVPSLSALDGDPVIVGPAGTRRALRRSPRPVLEVAAGGALSVGGAAVRAVEAIHDGGRWPVPGGSAAGSSVGYVIDERVYFAGDTEVFDGMAALHGIDVALLPIWGWGTSLGAGHMDPAQAADAVARIEPGIVIPIHWGTFLPVGAERRHRHLLRDPVDDFVRHVRDRATGVRVEALSPGGSLTL